MAAPAEVAAVEVEACLAPVADNGFGPWRCDAYFEGGGDLIDYWGSDAAMWGDTIIVGYAGEPDVDRGVCVVLER
ncbi:MAG: hypothetical protein KC486_33575, partial [Myxococcales bacterium]|nr:hypothetical protein [Myxococcales bacterium]